MGNFLLKGPLHFIFVIFFQVSRQFIDLRNAGFPFVNRTYDFLNHRCLFLNFGVLVSHVIQDLHWVVLPVQNFRHCLHVTLRDLLRIPKGFQFRKSIDYCLFQLLLISFWIGLV